jgi:three-Cys-motif partner protein
VRARLWQADHRARRRQGPHIGSTTIADVASTDMDDALADESEGFVEDLGGEIAGETETEQGSQFFVSKKAAAVLKHEILRQYVVPFVSKVGSNATDSRVVYLDGYAGPGRYKDGTPGSPALVLQSAADVAAFRTLDCYFVERTREDFKRLKTLVEEANAAGISARALHGPLKKHLDYVLERAEGAPLLAFLDPFGLGLSFDDLTGKIFGPKRPRGLGGWNATEVLLNFSANAVRRIGGLLRAAKENMSSAATLAAMDAACGGNWWREEFLESKDNSEAVERIARGFAERVGRAVGAGGWTVAVRNRVHQQPAYHLVFFSRSEHGLWLFGEANSLAQKVWRRECAAPPSPDYLFPVDDLLASEEKDRENGWVREIKTNIERLLAERGAFALRDWHIEVMGAAMDQARKMHIRTAVKQLYKEGKTSCNGIGEVEKFVITPP